MGADTLNAAYARLARVLHSVTPNVIWMTTIANHEHASRGIQLEQSLVGAHFRHIFDTAEYISSFRADQFFDGYVHLHYHGNALLACRLMARLHRRLIRETGARHACASYVSDSRGER